MTHNGEDSMSHRQQQRAIDDGDRESLATLLRAREVARILDVHPKRVYTLVGHIAVRCAPRTLRWRPTDIHKWIEVRRGE
jgi:hypothetical protein